MIAEILSKKLNQSILGVHGITSVRIKKGLANSIPK